MKSDLHMSRVLRHSRLMLGLITLITAAVATAQASTPQWAAYGLGSLYLVPVILSAISSGPCAAVTVGAIATAVSSVLVVGDASLDPRAVLLGVVFRGVGYIGVGTLVALYARSLHRLAYEDLLTGLPNRRAFFQHLSNRLSERHDVTVLACDVDDLKAINDCQGHAAGDAAICAVARDLVHALGPCAFVARVGGDEFLAVTQALPSAELVIPGASLGTATHVGGPIHLDHIVASADADLYRAKQRRHTRDVARGLEAA
jgi:Diguanylate cyclase, GGDEF domain